MLDNHFSLKRFENIKGHLFVRLDIQGSENR